VKVIDARQGGEVQIGQTVKYPPMGPTFGIDGIVPGTGGEPDSSSYTLLGVDEHLLSAEATIQFLESGEIQTVSLVVRYLHPGFFLQKVAFVPS